MRKLKKKLNRVMALIISILIIFSVTSCTGDSIFTGASKSITSYSIPNATVIIDEAAKTITATVPYATDLTALIATFTTTGSNVKVADALQASAISANDFTTPLVYTVEAADGSTQTYTVTVTQGSGPNPIVLGTAGNFVLLTEAGITTTGATVIIGDIGVSPIASASITGFALIMDTTGTFSTSTMVTGKIYAADYAMPTPTYTATAVSDMIAAYSDGLGRAAGVGITNFNLGGGTLNNDNLSPGTYTWASALTIPTDIMLTGGVNDVWIFQVAGTLNLAANKKIILVGGAQAKNIYWQVSGAVTLGADSVFNGAILTETSASLGTGATVNGSLLAQTAATLISNTITKE